MRSALRSTDNYRSGRSLTLAKSGCDLLHITNKRMHRLRRPTGNIADRVVNVAFELRAEILGNLDYVALIIFLDIVIRLKNAGF
jgi:hypothetical protein